MMPRTTRTQASGQPFAKLLSGLLALLVLSLGFAQDDPVELTFYSWRVEDRAAYEEIIAGFEEEHPHIRVTFRPFEAERYNTVLSTAYSAGEPPDIAHVRAYGGLETFAAPGHLLALDDLVPELEENFSSLALNSQRLRSDGRIYAVPFASQTLVLYYNADIFEELGLEPPETWDELLNTAETLQDNGIIPIANGSGTAWILEVFMGVFAPNFYGESFFDEVIAGETTFEDERFVGALERLLELEAYMPPGHSGIDYDTAQQLFVNEQAAMFAGGSWEIANFLRQNPDLNMGITHGPVPEAGQEPLVSSFMDGGYAVSADTPHQEEAVEFIRFLATPEFGQQLTDLLANVSPIHGTESNDPLLRRVEELNENATPYVMLVGFRYEQPTGSTLIQEALQRMFAGRTTPAEVGREVTEGIATYYEPFQNR